MNIQKDISLKQFNTFCIDVSAKYFYEVASAGELRELLFSDVAKTEKIMVLGGGSNVLFTKDFDGLIIKNNIRGINVVSENDEHIIVRSGAGEVWHHLVLWSLQKNAGGIENLSLIPGYAGAAPIQNIGAYGVEIKNVFEELEAMEIESGVIRKFSRDDCKFGYRDSVFKNELKNIFIITSVTLRLNKNPVFNTTYGAINTELERMGVTELSVKSISDAVINIRKSKLPDPAVIGNAGSFFKNPTISEEKFSALFKLYPAIPNYPITRLPDYPTYKLAAGWLIEQCGWKGKVVGNTGSHKDQALVLVNYGNATGKEIFDLASEIQRSVKDKFGVEIEKEVNVV
jgi:UDP-N-acetylmuramate dehydrogenase